MDNQIVFEQIKTKYLKDIKNLDEQNAIYQLYYDTYKSENKIWYNNYKELIDNYDGIINYGDNTHIYLIFSLNQFHNKISIIAHDGTKSNISLLFDLIYYLIMNEGYIIEASKAVSWLLKKRGTPLLITVSDIEYALTQTEKQKTKHNSNVIDLIVLNPSIDFKRIYEIQYAYSYSHYYITESGTYENKKDLFGHSWCIYDDLNLINRKPVKQHRYIDMELRIYPNKPVQIAKSLEQVFDVTTKDDLLKIVPAIREPAIKEPAIKEPAIKEPAIKESAIKEPAIKEPAIKEPAIKEPARPQVVRLRKETPNKLFKMSHSEVITRANKLFYPLNIDPMMIQKLSQESLIKSKLYKLMLIHPYLYRLSHKFKYVLFPAHDFIPTEYNIIIDYDVSHNNNINIIINDFLFGHANYINIYESFLFDKQIYRFDDFSNIYFILYNNYIIYYDIDTRIFIYINNTQIKKANLESHILNEAIGNYFLSYSRYGYEPVHKYKTIDRIDELSKSISVNDTEYDRSNPHIHKSIEDPDSNFNLIKLVRHYQISVYNFLYKQLNEIYNDILDKKINMLNYKQNILKLNRELGEFKHTYIMKNTALFSNFTSHYGYVSFNINIKRKLAKLHKEIPFIIDHQKPEFYANYDSHMIQEYLQLEHDVVMTINKLKLDCSDPACNDQVDKYNDEIDMIELFVQYFERYSGDIPEKETKKFNMLNKYVISNANLHRQNFIGHYIASFEIPYIYTPDPNKIVYSKRSSDLITERYPNGPINSPKYNLFCEYIKDKANIYDILDPKKSYAVFGINDNKIFRNLCTRMIYSSAIIQQKAIKTSQFYEYIFWSYGMNTFFLENELFKIKKQDDIKGLYIYNKKDPYTFYIDFTEKNYIFLMKNICRKTYIGFIQIECDKRTYNILIFMNSDKTLELVDMPGSTLTIGSINYANYVTYNEFKKMFDYNKLKLYRHSNNLLQKEMQMMYIGDLNKPQDNLVNLDVKNVKILNKKRRNSADNIKVIMNEDLYKEHKNMVLDNTVSNSSKYVISELQTGGAQKELDFELCDPKDYPGINYKILGKYYKKYSEFDDYIDKNIPNKDILQQIFYNNPYEYLYPGIRLYYKTQDGTDSEQENKITTMNDLFKYNNPINILYYKITTNSSLFFWEINYKYNLLEPHMTELYEINNFGYIAGTQALINDMFYPNNPQIMKVLSLNYLVTYKITTDLLLTQQTENYGRNYRDTKFININNKKDFDDELNNIKKIDFMYMQVHPYINKSLSTEPYSIYTSYLYYLHILTLVYFKINVGGNMCIYVRKLTNKLFIKILTIFCSLFEEYYIDTVDTNYDKANVAYLILKHRKQHIDIFITDAIIKLGEILNDIPDLGVFSEFCNLPVETLKSGYTNEQIQEKFKEKFNNTKIIQDIKFNEPSLIKLYKKIKHNVIDFNNVLYTRFSNNKSNIIEQYSQNVEKDILKIKKKNILACVLWSKKYNFPILHDIGSNDLNDFVSNTSSVIFEDMASYEPDMIFEIKNHNNTNTNTNTNIKQDLSGSIAFKNLPEYYNRALIKKVKDIRAIDYRNMDVYHKVKNKIDYYYKKITKIIAGKLGLRDDYISQAWLKMTEMLHKFDLIPKNKSVVKTFHLCELPGAFINAIKHYVKTETNIKDWIWRAESLNPKNMSEKDIRKAFGDEANLVEKNPENYDFGPKNTGDITDPDNLHYYRKHYGDNDFVTCDGGLPGSQTDISYILGYSMYLGIFSCTKKGGNAVIKRYVPISNNQELYMLYLFHMSFEKTIIYKPRVNYQSHEIYLIGLNYKGLDNDILDNMIEFIKSYKLIGFADNKQIPETFLLQINKMQHMILNNLDAYIRKKIYFTDNFDKITDEQWDKLQHIIKDKMNEWLTTFPIKHV